MNDKDSQVIVTAGPLRLAADLAIPENAQGVVLFAHGSGSSRFSPRNRDVATRLRRAGLATLLMDLLTQEEEVVDRRTGHLRFDIPLLASRLVGATDWLRAQPELASVRIGYFGASTGAAAALIAAAERPDIVRAVVSRGGRPDLAGATLRLVQAPTLLIVGERDDEVVELNRGAFKQLRCLKRMEIIPEASHLFEEPGTLEIAADLATDWFTEYLHESASSDASDHTATP